MTVIIVIIIIIIIIIINLHHAVSIKEILNCALHKILKFPFK